MYCPRHTHQPVKGYCTVCGEFGCERCLAAFEGKLYCARDYKAAAGGETPQGRHNRPERQRLVAHLRNGDVFHGVCFDFNPAREDFHLDLVDKAGQPRGEVRLLHFEDLKALFFVKSFDGRFDHHASHPTPGTKATELILCFDDGEVLHGYATPAYRQEEPRFYFLPDDPQTNNVALLVERTALKHLCTPEEYKNMRQRELQAYIDLHRPEGRPKEELTGDFHFERAEYVRALKHYRNALRAHSDPRIRKKLLGAQYNIGVRYIKSHDYKRALQCMEMVLDAAPDHQKAQEKAKKLRHALDRHTGRDSHRSAEPVI